MNNVNFYDTSSIKDSKFEVLEKMEVIESDLSYDEVCDCLLKNKHKLFGKYVRIKILNKYWGAEYFLSQELHLKRYTP
jgi:capsid portal protein